jgi:hypothetical protein
MEENTKKLRRDDPEYNEIKVHKLSYNDGLRRLFLNLPNWKQLSRVTGILNVPTDLDDRLRIQADLKRKYGKR